HNGQSLRRDPDEPEIRRLGTVDYAPTWDLQRTLAEERADGTREDTVLLLEHPATYTAGKRTEPEDRPADGTPVVDVDRVAASPGTARGSWSAIRSSPWRTRSTSWSTSGGSSRPSSPRARAWGSR